MQWFCEQTIQLPTLLRILTKTKISHKIHSQERIRARQAKLVSGALQTITKTNGVSNDGKAIVAGDDIDLDDPLGIAKINYAVNTKYNYSYFNSHFMSIPYEYNLFI